jgi:hypothetical protein
MDRFLRHAAAQPESAIKAEEETPGEPADAVV